MITASKGVGEQELTTAPFPDLNREALAYVLDALEQQYQGGYINLEDLAEHDQQKLTQLLEGANFGKLYTWALEKVTPASEEALSNTQGEWVKYDQGKDHMTLVKSLQGHGTGWCTAGESTAKTQLNAGDFYVFYSLDDQGKASVPRAAIRMEHGKIAEVRGVAEQQNLDPAIAQVVGAKLAEFPDGAAYEKKASDMARLTLVEKKITSGEQLNQTDLAFLYELDAPIQGFGYQKDPRIVELRSKRNPTEDAPIVFGCEPNQIAHTVDAINSNTKAYVGELKAGIFNKIQEFNIEHVYTTFPEGKIQRYEIEVGGKDAAQLEAELEQKNIDFDYGKYLLESTDFEQSRLKQAEQRGLVRLTVADLGFSNGATTQQIYDKAAELGLYLCSSDVGPQLRLQSESRDYMVIAMKQIFDRNGRPGVFSLRGDDEGLRLSAALRGQTTSGVRLQVCVLHP